LQTRSLKPWLAPPALLLAALVLAVAAPTADASVVIGQSVAGVKLGSTQAQVEQALGPTSSPFPNELFYSLPVGLRVAFKHGHVRQILSYSKRQRTAKGITIGSTHAQLQSAYPQDKCVEGHAPTYVYCVVAARIQGRSSYTGFLSESPTGGIVEIETGFGSVAQALKHP
jgi:hypothetical protein